MKKIYVKPEIDVVEVDNNVYMLTVSAEGDEGLPGVSTGGNMSGGSADANRHRGEWGNLWAED